MKKNQETIQFVVKLTSMYYAASVVIYFLLTQIIGLDNFNVLSLKSFVVGSLLVIANFSLAAYDLNFLLVNKKKSIFLSKSLVRYFLLFIILIVLNIRFELNIIIIAFEILAFQLSAIFVNMFGLSGLLLEKGEDS